MDRLPGFRDFYPEPLPPTKDELWSMDARNHLFDTWRAVARRYGLVEKRWLRPAVQRAVPLLRDIPDTPMDDKARSIMFGDAQYGKR